MPTYQYACSNAECGNQFELVQSFTDASASECPVCGGPVRKVFSAVGVVFKGSGFYRNDSRSKTSSADAPAAASSSSSTSSDSGSSSSTSTSSSSSSSGGSSSPAAAAPAS